MIKRIGIFGGSFDPIHYGHIRLACAALGELGLNKVVFLPARMPPHKNRLCASAYHRLSMIRLAIKKHPEFSVSRYELNRNSATYTKKSISYFKRYYSRSRIYFLIGGDSLRDMHAWSGGYGLLDQCDFAVGLRPGISRKIKKHKNVIILKKNMPDIASRDIRKELKKGRVITRLAPEPVRAYIKKKKIYA